MGAVEHADHVHVDDFQLVFEGHFVEEAAHHNAGVVEQNVHASVCGCAERCHRRVKLGLVADIQGLDNAVVRAQLGLQCLQAVQIQVKGADKPALFVEETRCFAAHARCRACDENGLPPRCQCHTPVLFLELSMQRH